jgi:hypothetical protein
MPSVSTSIKDRQQAMWASGDFAVIGTTLQIVGELSAKASIFAPASACSTWRRQRQRDAGGGAPLRKRDLDRLRARASRAWAGASRAEGLARHVSK